MYKRIAKKLGVGGVLALTGLLIAGAAFAAQLFAAYVSTGNKISAVSAPTGNLSITNNAFNISGLALGGSTSVNPLTIKNTGNTDADLTIGFNQVVGSLCPSLTLTITGDASGSGIISNNTGEIDLGTINVGQTFNLNQVISETNNPANQGQNCTWAETATLNQ